MTDYITELRRALYPDGLKHPQQGEWYWMIEEVMRLRANQAPVYKPLGQLHEN